MRRLKRCLLILCCEFLVLLFNVHAVPKPYCDLIKCENSFVMANDGTKDCDFCLTETLSLSHVESHLLHYLDLKDIYLSNYTHDEFTWSFSKEHIVDYENITVTLYQRKDEKDKSLKHPISGCCGIPLSKGGCGNVQCMDSSVFISLALGNERAVTSTGVQLYKKCLPSKQNRTFFYICPDQVNEWTLRYQSRCVQYNSQTGDMRLGVPQARQTGLQTSDSIFQEWTSATIPVCLFTLSKDEVHELGKPVTDPKAMDPTLFGKAVYQIGGINHTGAAKIDSFLKKCQTVQYRSTELFNITFIKIFENNTFVCLILWPYGTVNYTPSGKVVKCLSQEKTVKVMYITDSHIYHTKMKSLAKQQASDLMVIIFCVTGASIVFIISLICLYRGRAFLRKWLNEALSGPREWDSVWESVTYGKTLPTKCAEDEENPDPLDTQEILKIDSKEKKEVIVEAITQVNRPNQISLSHQTLSSCKDGGIDYAEDSKNIAWMMIKNTPVRVVRYSKQGCLDKMDTHSLNAVNLAQLPNIVGYSRKSVGGSIPNFPQFPSAFGSHVPPSVQTLPGRKSSDTQIEQHDSGSFSNEIVLNNAKYKTSDSLAGSTSNVAPLVGLYFNRSQFGDKLMSDQWQSVCHDEIDIDVVLGSSTQVSKTCVIPCTRSCEQTSSGDSGFCNMP
ncbi:uncharacterized protein LOC143448874 [Clavelina lepadiformis]|uniref:uncharacterized protein LOC143448874 n=1 Tax=Clavelina lepadiformis TaxID=159417 RepID=UPI004042EFA1